MAADALARSFESTGRFTESLVLRTERIVAVEPWNTDVVVPRLA